MTQPQKPGRNTQFLTRALSGEAWSIMHQALENVQNLIASGQDLRAEGEQPQPEAVTQRVPLVRNNGRTVAVVTLHGVVVNRAPKWAESYGYISPQNFAAEVRALADDASVSAIVLSIDSPGGTVAGTVEAAEAVAYARSRKKVTAVASETACSAAYWIAAQASEIVVAPTGLIGSIGVIMSHADYTQALSAFGILVTYIRSAAKKALGQPYEPLSEEARAEFQAMVDNVHGQFVSAVAKGRRKARSVVAERWATGQVWTGQEGVTAGLADRVASLGTVVGELTGAIVPPEPDPPPPDPVDDENADDPEASVTPLPAASGDPDPPAAEQTSPTDDPPARTEAGSSTDPTPAPDAQEDRMNIAAISAKLAAGEKLTAEERHFLDEHLKAQEGGSAAAGTTTTPPAGGNAPATGTPSAGVDLSSLSPEVRTMIEQANARAEAAERTANTERDTRLNREFRERALALGQPAAFGATLRSAHEKLSADEYKALEQSLNATGAQLQLLGETGSSQDDRSAGGSTGSVQAEYENRVTAAMKADTKLTRAAAGQKVMRDDPAFAARYRGR